MNNEQKRRYSRHIQLDGFGAEAQQRLIDSRVLLIGAGGIGSPCALYLAAAGVGTIGIVDGDIVSLSNLQRQVLHYTSDTGRDKVDSAREKMNLINPDVKVETYNTFLTEDNALEIIDSYDFIIDGTDSYASKYLVNDACILAGKPFCCGGVIKWGGQLMTHIPGTACYRCLFPEPPEQNQVETCSLVGVLSPAVGVMGSLMSCEAIKYLSHTGELLTNALLSFDVRTMQFAKMEFAPDADCPLCGQRPTITTLKEYSFQPCRKK
ncbi:MAG: HesA/MoeB/ThiF family protein [Bacteroidales bacterium]|nr:HesA/MoeB/ThiF family protein [Bacteroidales bacterium]